MATVPSPPCARSSSTSRPRLCSLVNSPVSPAPKPASTTCDSRRRNIRPHRATPTATLSALLGRSLSWRCSAQHSDQQMGEPTGNILVYGSLMAPEVTKLLIGRMPSTQPATLKDHMRYCVKEADFPAIFPVDGGEVKGLLIQDLTENELVIFDEYEDDDYHRATVTVQAEDGEEHRAFVYVWNEWVRDRLDTGRLWDYEEFRRDKLDRYVQMVRLYAQDVHVSDLWELPPDEVSVEEP